MMTRTNKTRATRNQTGMTLVELMVALAIGSFLMIGAVQVYNQSRQAFIINESIARVQETAQFAMDTIEAELRMASNWGMQSRGTAIEGRSLPGDLNPLAVAVPPACGSDWALDMGNPIEGENNTMTLPCGAVGGLMPNTDSFTVRRTAAPISAPLAGTMQVQTSRIQGQIFTDGNVPAAFDPAASETHNLITNTYYVAADSALIPGVPALRRKFLVGALLGPNAIDQEIAPGVENMQVQFGVDINNDNTVDRYVNPGDPIITLGNINFIPGSRVITARVWLVVRSLDQETGLTDNVNYQPGDVTLGTFSDKFRRMQVSKTILLRNARS